MFFHVFSDDICVRNSSLFCCFLIFVLIGVEPCCCIQLTAYVSHAGLHGQVTFQQQSGTVVVQTSLQAVDEHSEWSWAVRELPVLYNSVQDMCHSDKLGSIVVNLDEMFGKLELPANASAELAASQDEVMLTGPKGLWGRSLYLEMIGDRSRRACTTITVSDNADEKVAEAKFFSPVAGSVFLRWVGSHHSGSTDTLLHVQLYHIDPKANTSQHNWKIYTTDILDSEADKSRDNCNFLQLVFDPGFTSTPGQAVGDLDTRIGKVRVGTSLATVYHDEGLTSLSVDLLGGQRSLYLVIFDSQHADSFLACAKIQEIRPTVLKALIQSHGVKGDVTLSQRSPFDPTWVRMNLTSVRDVTMSTYKIHELPCLTHFFDNPCLKVGQVFNPSNIQENQESGSQDTYAVGDLSGKHNMWRQEQTLTELNGPRWDVNLPLYGPHSVAHRTLVFYRKNDSRADGPGVPWICGTFARYTSIANGWKVAISTAGVVFRYPTVGRIIFRQPRNQPWTDTTVIVEMLVHSDGTSLNNTADHRWAVHEFPEGKDYYNWTGRCLSTGAIFNPYKVAFDPKEQDTLCNLHQPGYCRLGDLSVRLGTLNIAGSKKNVEKLTRRVFTDPFLPLSGSASIMGRSLVLYDDNGPKARGERLACSTIYGIYRRKAVIKDWYGNGEVTSIKGKIELFEQTEYDVTDVEVDVEALRHSSGYHIHVAPVQGDLEFPCEGSSLYGYWNPFDVNASSSPPPGVGTSDQYEMGDLSGKFGLLNGLESLVAAYNDTRLPLFGNNAVIGRSVVINKKNNVRWVCSSIERGYAPGEARELRAIASFHHPLGYAWGYIRMTQLVYNDGSKSETVIEVNLRHPGKYDRNLTRHHLWAVYVNPVGVDATVKVQNTRCVAGGYQWNPFYTQLADPLNDELYREECGPDNPLRCYVGDVSGRLGTINLGDKRQVFTDSNLPLEGDVSAMGRSIVIFDKDRGSQRFACANIEPDKDIIKYVNIRKPPRFVVTQFIDDVREVMGLPEWMLTVDSRKTRMLHGGTCIQFLLHFKGPLANQLEQDFSRLLANGFLASPSLYNPGYVPGSKRKTHISYRPCGSRDPNSKKSSISSTTEPAACTAFAVVWLLSHRHF